MSWADDPAEIRQRKIAVKGKSLPKEMRTLVISIVTPSFNQADFIEEALWSVKNQDYPLAEHVVIDGGSTDGTVEILKHYSSQPGWGHLHWFSESDHGQSDALNKGFRIVKGEIVGWLNSDDRYRSGCFEAVLEGVRKHETSDVLYGDCTWIDACGRVTRVRREIEFSNFILKYHRVLFIPTASTFFRRHIFDEGGTLDGQFHYAMDYDFFLRLASRGYRFQHIPKLLADFRWHEKSKSSTQSEKMLAEHDRIAVMNSLLLQKVPDGKGRRLLFFILRKMAASLRYAQKCARGCYLEDWLHHLELLKEMGKNF